MKTVWKNLSKNLDYNIWIEPSVEAERLIATINNKLKEDFSIFQL